MAKLRGHRHKPNRHEPALCQLQPATANANRARQRQGRTAEALHAHRDRGRLLSLAGWRALGVAGASFAVCYFTVRVIVGLILRSLPHAAGAAPFILGAVVLAIGGGR